MFQEIPERIVGEGYLRKVVNPTIFDFLQYSRIPSILEEEYLDRFQIDICFK